MCRGEDVAGGRPERRFTDAVKEDVFVMSVTERGAEKRVLERVDQVWRHLVGLAQRNGHRKMAMHN